MFNKTKEAVKELVKDDSHKVEAKQLAKSLTERYTFEEQQEFLIEIRKALAKLAEGHMNKILEL